ncbi:MAG: FKBP-type peptidyl-prolyl cis-trans isomerase [Nitrospirota bacterium]|nr:FKBP-type peptidyl-prolyl cis-trans isomerase [Nitrospirota bacterium]
MSPTIRSVTLLATLWLGGTLDAGAEGPRTATRDASRSGAPSSSTHFTTPSGVDVQDIEPGSGEPVGVGRTVSVFYSGWLEDGTLFDTSRSRVRPVQFHIGDHQVIRGWEEGISGMRLGGVRRLRVPPELAYGAQGVPGIIPPNTSLLFEIRLDGVD